MQFRASAPSITILCSAAAATVGLPWQPVAATGAVFGCFMWMMDSGPIIASTRRAETRLLLADLFSTTLVGAGHACLGWGLAATLFLIVEKFA